LPAAEASRTSRRSWRTGQINKTVVYPWQTLALYRPETHFALFGGVATGKTFIGSHFSIDNLEDYAGLTGLIGANTYDQLSQATIREFVYWLDHYKYEYWMDEWPREAERKKFKTYKNVISVRPKKGGPLSHILTRVMSKPNPLRGVEASWYWLDEVKDTPEITHDVVLARLRESMTTRGLVTGTTNGQDWSYKRFVLNPNKKLYGYTHVKTSDSVKAGIISEDYYQGMLQSYSPLMAAQELDAEHVNFGMGRAYYTASNDNQRSAAPWGDGKLDPTRPLIVGCDFNFSPSPATWVIGQTGPSGSGYEDCIHWFFEIAEAERGTPQMTVLLMQRTTFEVGGGSSRATLKPFLKIFGDASGGIGSTSNAGDTDYNQISYELAKGNRQHTIDVERSNPLVRERVENVCRILKAADNRIRMTYNPQTCPNLDSDLKVVGWKVSVMAKRARLDDKGDYMRTHASDAAGYAIWKIFPPNLRQLRISKVLKEQ
jgi:hypothetical protein